MRITGMASGLDTDALIKQMMKPYNMKVDKMKQDRQMVEWKQELYRDIIADTSAIRDTYFNNLKPDTNVLRESNYSGFDITAISSTAGENTGASATASPGAVAGEYKVEVMNLATAPSVQGGSPAGKGINSTLGVDGTTIIKFKYTDSKGVSQTKEIKDMDANTTVKQFMDKITKDTAGEVNLSYSELTKSFTLKTTKTGLTSSLTVDDQSAVFGKLSLTVPKTAITGADAVVKITPPGSTVATSVTGLGNTFSIDKVNYTLTKIGTTNINVTGNSQKTYDKIKGFIDIYNGLVEKVSGKADEKKQYKYLPLTDEQRAAMKEEEIKQWETKAKVGLLKGDSNLDNMLTSMRRAFFDEVKDSGISLSEIGLSTSKDISKRGKIIIDEEKLKTAIETRGEQVADLFAKQSTTHTSYSPDYDINQRKTRNEEQGIFQRISDIIEDYAGTRRNISGKKGILLEKAGIKGDATEFKSFLSEDIIKKDKKITEMIKNLAARENSFYLKFSKLETAMNKLNSQSSWLTQQLGGGQ